MSGLSDIEAGVTDLCEAAATPYKQIHDEKYTTGLNPLRPPVRGRRGSARYSLTQILAVRIARLLDRKFGVQVADMSPLVSRLWHMVPAELAAEFAAGRTHCLVIGKSVGLELVSQSAVTELNQAVKAQGHSVAAVGIAIENELSRVLEALGKPVGVN